VSRAILLAALAALGAGCVPYAAVRDPLPPTLDLGAPRPRGGEEAPAEAEANGTPTPDRWWTAFGDPALTEAVEEAVVENFQVRAAWARVRQADTLGAQADSQRWPQLTAQIEAGRRRIVLVLPDAAREIENNTFSLSLPVSYEIDVLGRVDAQVQAAGYDFVAARDDVEALAMTVAANVVEAWISVIYQRALRRLLEQQLAASEVYRELLELRFAEGLGTALDVFQQRAQVEGLHAQIALTFAQESVAEQQLAVLLGRLPGAPIVPPDRVALPEVPASPGRGVPADLLVRRPDVRAARRRVEAADQRVAAAIADRFPRLTLTGSLGLSSPDLGTLFQSFVYSIVGSVLGPIFDGERREAIVQQHHAIVWERTEQLAQILVTAALEVESALVQERQQREHLAALEARVEASRNALAEARDRFAAGILPEYLNVLTALTALHQAEQSLLQARRQLLSFRVQLYRALGGSWTADLQMPAPRRPMSAETRTQEQENG
jgi:NodT family efflux transporter outer membrane factor (OMF) lipoprotein